MRIPTCLALDTNLLLSLLACQVVAVLVEHASLVEYCGKLPISPYPEVLQFLFV